MDLGTEKHQKMRSNWYLLEVEFLKNVLPPTRELDSRGCALPRIDQNNVFFERFEPRPSWNHILAIFCDFRVPGGAPKPPKFDFLGFWGASKI